MSDLKLISVIIFTIIGFGIFVSIYNSSESEFNYNDSTNDSVQVDSTTFDTLKDIADMETFSTFGAAFVGGLGFLVVFLILRYIRGQ